LASYEKASSTNSSSARLSQRGFTACDVVELYLHRGAFEPALVLTLGLGAGMLADHLAMGLEPEAGTGASVRVLLQKVG